MLNVSRAPSRMSRIRTASIAVSVSLSLLSEGLGAQAQGAAPGPTSTTRYPEVQLDRNSAAISAVLPFDEPFILTGTAGATLLSVQVWYADTTKLARRHCDSSAVLAKKLAAEEVRFSSWNRRGTPTTFWIPMATLPPNRPFTFCINSIEALSAADSAAFVTRTATGLRRKLLEKVLGVDSGRFTPAKLHALHDVLRSALPAPERVVVPAGSVLNQRPVDKDSLTKFDTLIFETFLDFRQPHSDRLLRAAALTRNASDQRYPRLARGGLLAAPPGACLDGAAVLTPAEKDRRCDTPLGWQLLQVSRNPALAELSAVERSLNMGGSDAQKGGASGLAKAEAERLSAAAAIARRMGGAGAEFDGPKAEAIGAGILPVGDPGYPTAGDADFKERWSVTEMTAWAANLDTTIVRLGDLRGLVAYVKADARRRQMSRSELAKFDEDLAGLDRQLHDAFRSAADQRSDMRLFISSLSEFDQAIQTLVGKLAGRDLSRTGLFSSTSATYEARARWYVGQDLGVIYGWRGSDVRQASPYLGLNFYVRPINKRAPKPVLCIFNIRCTSISVGVPTNSWEAEDRYAGILAGRPLAIGIGTRVGDFFRVSYSRALVYRYEFLADSERRRHLSSIGAVSLTLDTDLREIISGVANAVFPK